ncbi:MAG: exodeoxyribonuclease VII large subunit [Candidatus Omnitrophota bacterium]|nr:exodeoxyribonuclease VII large subunit [Candidatus Omnitrophota bacterium]
MKAAQSMSLDDIDSTRRVYTVSDLNREVRILLEGRFEGALWVEGELSNCKYHSSGHIYFSLKDDKSQINAAFFSRQNQSLKFRLKDGLKVLALARPSLYEARGQYQLYIDRMEPQGVGSLQMAFLQMKERLEKEGLFRVEHKQEIPKFPRTVGVITSSTGAAIRDILNVVGRRFQGTEVLLYPVRVQGDGAAAEIAQAVLDMNRWGLVDVMIVGRGGGSLEDLWAFNEEAVARAVYESRIPVISAVGHEIDWTICDLVADLRAPTPSAAAELVVQNRDDIQNRFKDYETRIRNSAVLLVGDLRERLETLKGSYAFRQPLAIVEQHSQHLDELVRQLQNYIKTLWSQKNHELRGVCGKLHALSPLAILERGYSLSFRSDGSLIKDTKRIKVGDAIKTRTGKGIVHSQVTKIE